MDAKEIIDRQKKLAADRSTFDNHWQEIARYVIPRADDFFSGNERTPGEKRTEYLVDSVAPLALERFASAMESILTPRSSRWHKMTVTDEFLSKDQSVQEWLDQVTDLLFKVRYSTQANFASQQHEVYMSLGAFGTGVLIVEDMPGRGIRYKSSHLAEHYFVENAHGRVDTNYRFYKLTALQAAQKFPAGLPQAIVTASEKEPNRKFEFIHCVQPNPDYKPGSPNPKQYKFISHHVSIEGSKRLSTGGFRTFPFIISRYVTSPNEIYGRSPAMTALPEIKMVNAMRKSDLRARHLAIDSPILTANEQSIRRLNMQPRAINYGTLGPNGEPLVKPYQSGARIDVSNDALVQSYEVINDIFLVKLFQILVDSPAMTATEVLQRAQEKGALLSPTMGRQQSEALGPMIEREIDILNFNGLLPPMPDVLKEAQDQYEIEYTSPLSKMQKAEEAVSAQRLLENTLPLTQIDPSIMDTIDLREYINIQREAFAVPAKMFRSKEEQEALAAARAEQEQLASLVTAAPQVAGSIKDIAQAQSYAEA